MTDRETLLQLADRCEKATGPDRELGEAIAKAVGWKREGFNLGKGIYDPNGNWHMHEPLFAASLDAAMTLYARVPERVPSDPRLAAAEALRQRAGDA